MGDMINLSSRKIILIVATVGKVDYLNRSKSRQRLWLEDLVRECSGLDWRNISGDGEEGTSKRHLVSRLNRT